MRERKTYDPAKLKLAGQRLKDIVRMSHTFIENVLRAYPWIHYDWLDGFGDVKYKNNDEDCENPKRLKYMLDYGAYAPERAHSDDAGLDLRTPKRVVVRRGESVSIDTGVHVQIPHGWFGKLESKSGLNVNSGIVSLGGVIDSGYTGSIVVKLYNFGGNYHVFEAGDKIVQMVVQPCFTGDLYKVDELTETERGKGGFGSTGEK